MRLLMTPMMLLRRLIGAVRGDRGTKRMSAVTAVVRPFFSSASIVAVGELELICRCTKPACGCMVHGP